MIFIRSKHLYLADIMFLKFLNNRIHMKNYGKTKHCCAFTMQKNNWICHEKFRLKVSRDTFERIIKFKLKSISFCVNYKRIKKNIYHICIYIYIYKLIYGNWCCLNEIKTPLRNKWDDTTKKKKSMSTATTKNDPINKIFQKIYNLKRKSFSEQNFFQRMVTTVSMK